MQLTLKDAAVITAFMRMTGIGTFPKSACQRKDFKCIKPVKACTESNFSTQKENK